MAVKDSIEKKARAAGLKKMGEKAAMSRSQRKLLWNGNPNPNYKPITLRRPKEQP